MSGDIAPERLALLLGLSFFFGLAFEEFYAKAGQARPGGVRTFPLLALAGAGLYLIEPAPPLAFAAGLLVLGAWLHGYYVEHLANSRAAGGADAELMVPACNLLAFLLGPVTFLRPIWVSVALTVIAVLLLGARERLHRLAEGMPPGETATAGKFLVLTGIVLPLLPNQPVSALTTITPYQVWLAVVAVSTLSYGSYLVQRYVWPSQGVWLAAILGRLDSSTATTVMLARRAGETDRPSGALHLPLARALAVPLGALCLLALLAPDGGATAVATSAPQPHNPLELSAAPLFAAVFVIVSLATNWARTEFGHDGILWLAAIVGVSDIDPFVLNLAQGGGGLRAIDAAAAIVIATSSNNLLKAAYCLAARWRTNFVPAVALVALAVAGVLAAVATSSVAT